MESILFFLLGIVLFVIEMFISIGISAALGFISFLAAIVFDAYFSDNLIRSLSWSLSLTLLITVFFIYMLNKLGIWHNFILKEKLTKEEGFIPQISRDHWVGKRGTSLTDLHPAGLAFIDNERVDVITSGEYIHQGVSICVVSVDGTRILVRQVQDSLLNN